jgi:hypothetical protein
MTNLLKWENFHFDHGQGWYWFSKKGMFVIVWMTIGKYALIINDWLSFDWSMFKCYIYIICALFYFLFWETIITFKGCGHLLLFAWASTSLLRPCYSCAFVLMCQSFFEMLKWLSLSGRSIHKMTGFFFHYIMSTFSPGIFIIMLDLRPDGS